jgi:hypothetical protein
MRRVIGRLAMLAVAGALTFLALPAGSASAGTNGQQVKFCVGPQSNKAMIVGENQDGQQSELVMDVQPLSCDNVT